MDRLDQALTRIGSALDRLEDAMEAPPTEAAARETHAAGAPDLRIAHDQLEDEVRALRARAQEDAKLRAEAADAVREALRDLRGAMADQIETGAPSHA